MKPSAVSALSATSAHARAAATHDDRVATDTSADALSFAHVSVSYRIDGRDCGVLHDLSLRIGRGEAYGLVGESGCGKSTAALAAVRYLPRGGKLQQGQIHIAGQAVNTLDATALRHLRARSVSMIYQDAGSALNPSMTVGRQLIEAFQMAHATARRADLVHQAEAMLARVRIDAPSEVMRLYPHQLSGGMQQRIVIAMALASRPVLLILDEPTTGLDSTVEAEVLSLLREIRDAESLAMLFISHDLGVVASMCERVGILYAGELIEEGDAEQVLRAPRHPYTVGLLRCLPAGRSRADGGELASIPGTPPSLGRRTNRNDACAFADRCGLVKAKCVAAAPPLYDVPDSRMAHRASVHLSRCYFHEEAGALPIAESSPGAQTDRISPAIHHTAQPAAQSDAPRADRNDGRDSDGTPSPQPILRAIGVSKTFDSGERKVKALDDVSFVLHAGQTLGLVGESGSGKSTLARVMLGLETPDEGATIELNGRALPYRVSARSPEQIRAMQIVFQRADAALNRAWSVRRLVSRAIHKMRPNRPTLVSTTRGNGSERTRQPHRDERLHDLLAAVRLAPHFLQARTAALSGGLKQRVAIASAFAGEPQIVICDEPTSALDVSVQAAILNLLTDLQRRQGVSYLFISHDLEVIRYLADQIAVLYRGRIVEVGPAECVLSGPNHPYTAQLLSAAASHALPSTTGIAPNAEMASEATSGNASESAAKSAHIPLTSRKASSDPTPEGAAEVPPGGCVYAPRCAMHMGAVCEESRPMLHAIDATHSLACHLPTHRLPRFLPLNSAAKSV